MLERLKRERVAGPHVLIAMYALGVRRLLAQVSGCQSSR